MSDADSTEGKLPGTEPELSCEALAPLVGTSFRVVAPDGSQAEFVLREARDLSERMQLPEGYRRPFSLLFDAPEDVALAHGTLTFHHESHASFSAFCSAVISPEGQGKRAYEVVFA